ncbi:hypothetical protein Amet_1270 [Alkaliphilus metalliredigens QYMF]|uniref:General stress protein n=1 Tax=Alkaliphilus metalliredigens (strain QYMF) TaxID=293826 RepID=A6TMQ8_ALKMQ|nr:YtxH domain-containing protein [Alkaliphilus metalliredigens]ABR47476.1 hypothetical protein Amet_1270 [Alkaliphilus metalliredigens QYMF]
MNVKDLQSRVDKVRDLLDPNRIERQKKKARQEGVVKGIAFGAIIGSITGIFFAPDKGENTRKKTKEELEKAKDKLEVNLEIAKDKFEVNFEEGKEKFSEVVDTKKEVVLSKVEALKEKMGYDNSPNVINEEELESIEEEGTEEETEKIEG